MNMKNTFALFGASVTALVTIAGLSVMLLSSANMDGFLPLLAMILGFLQIAIPFVLLSILVGLIGVFAYVITRNRKGLGHKLMNIIQRI